jgi:aldose 1-epimerase
MGIIKRRFGDSPASLYTITQDSPGAAPLTLTLTDLGASVAGIVVPDREGNPTDIVLGYDSYEGYMRGEVFQGAVVGRVANRIGGASFRLGGKDYALSQNCNGIHTLHGGRDFWCKRIWSAAPSACGNAVTFSLISPDGDQGFPGEVRVDVTYRLEADGRIRISYRAETDKDTPLNLTNHTYFNLDGHGAGDVTDHMMILAAHYFTPTDGDSIPTGEIWSVKNSALDFTSEKRIGQDIDAEERQIALAGGHDHNYILDEHDADHPVARVRSRRSGISLELYTDLPGIQFYTGNSLGKDPGTKGGGRAVRRGGFCLETQYYPDALHHEDFPSIILEKGQTFTSETSWLVFTY